MNACAYPFLHTASIYSYGWTHNGCDTVGKPEDTRSDKAVNFHLVKPVKHGMAELGGIAANKTAPEKSMTAQCPKSVIAAKGHQRTKVVENEG